MVKTTKSFTIDVEAYEAAQGMVKNLSQEVNRFLWELGEAKKHSEEDLENEGEELKKQLSILKTKIESNKRKQEAKEKAREKEEDEKAEMLLEGLKANNPLQDIGR